MTGSVQGSPFRPLSASAQRYNATPFGSPPYDGINVRLSEATAVCDPSSRTGIGQANKRVLDLTVRVAVDAGLVTSMYPATLTVRNPDCTTNGRCSVGGGSGCSQLNPVEAGQATVTFTELTNRVRGTFSASLTSGSSISGSFDADLCMFWDWEVTNEVQCRP